MRSPPLPTTAPPRAAVLVAAFLWPAVPLHAIERIDFEAATVELGGALTLRSVTAQLGLHAAGRAALQATAREATATQAGIAHRPAALGGLRLRCERVVLQEPDFRCASGALHAQRTPIGVLQADVEARFDSGKGAADLRLTGLAVADGRLDLHATSDGSQWRVDAGGWQGTLAALAPVLHPWWQPPEGWQLAGQLSLSAGVSGHDAQPDSGTLVIQLHDLTAQNADATLASDKVAVDATVALAGTTEDWRAQVQLHGTGGQALAGPALLDFAVHPVTLQAQLTGRGAGDIHLRDLQLVSDGLARAHGEARVALAPTPALHDLQLDLDGLQFPAAYVAFLQLPLATSDFGNLQSRGTVRGSLQWRDGRPRSLDLASEGLDFTDEGKSLALLGLQGELHWRAAGSPAPSASRVQWRAASAFGLDAGATTLRLLAQGQDLLLTEPARIPLFDGALQIQRFEARQLGTNAVELDFDGRIDAIGMPLLSRAFGWPEMAGTLSGRLPGLSYRGGTLSVAGDIAAGVFDGTITASGLQLRDAFGRFPRLRGTFTARGLDLEAITRTFPIGSITGRLDADVQGLELFGWTPVAFDAHLYTTPGDRTRHRISQKAVNSLANLGGGGGGVMAALQSGFLRFFDEFGYDRIGLRCQLRDDVCLMNGIARPEGGFYIVKGGGLPRLDIVGTSGRVAWSQLLSQVGAALGGGQVEIR